MNKIKIKYMTTNEINKNNSKITPPPPHIAENRIQWIDSTRGFALILMVIGHVIAWQFEDYSKVLPFNYESCKGILTAGFLHQMIYSFHMGLFFMLSGYLLYKTGGRSLYRIMINKSKALLVPYIVTGFIILIVREKFGYWFLFSLFELLLLGTVMMNILEKINMNRKIWIDAISILISYVLLRRLLSLSFLQNNYVNIAYCMEFYLPFMFGFVCRKYSLMEKNYKSLYTLVAIVYLTLFFFRYIPDENLFIHQFKRVSALLNYFSVMPITGSILSILFIKSIKSEIIHTILSYIGKFTLEIYILHVFFVIEIRAISDYWLSCSISSCIASQITYSVLVGAIAIVLSLILQKVICRSKLLNGLLFGKW